MTASALLAHDPADVTVCEKDRSAWNTHPCTNPADVIIGGVAICAECANRTLMGDTEL